MTMKIKEYNSQLLLTKPPDSVNNFTFCTSSPFFTSSALVVGKCFVVLVSVVGSTAARFIAAFVRPRVQ